MAPTTAEPGAAEAPSGGLNHRVDEAFAAYAGTLDVLFPAGPGATGIADAYARYAEEVGRVFSAPDLAKRAWELYVGYFRALQGAPPDAPRFGDLMQSALDVGRGHQKVLETYQALVTASLRAVDGGNADAVEEAFLRYATDVRDAWAAQEPADLTPAAVLAASQSALAAASLHGLVHESVRPAGATAADTDAPAGEQSIGVSPAVDDPVDTSQAAKEAQGLLPATAGDPGDPASAADGGPVEPPPASPQTEQTSEPQ